MGLNEVWSIPIEIIDKVKPKIFSESVLIYDNERMTEDVASYIQMCGLSARYLNSDIDAETAKEIVREFNDGETAFLITTPEFAEQFHLVML